MIIGAHSLLHSRKPEADRKFFRDVLSLPGVDVGGGWLIFGLPPAELAIHPGKNGVHELYLMCDDIEAFLVEMRRRKIRFARVHDAGWGLVTRLTLPGGGELGVYEPRHPRPKPMKAKGNAVRMAPAKARARRRKKGV